MHYFRRSARIRDNCALGRLTDSLEGHVLSVSKRDPLRFQKQIMQVGVAAAAVEQHANVAVDGFHNAKSYLRPEPGRPAKPKR